jgi:hypothetical protein
MWRAHILWLGRGACKCESDLINPYQSLLTIDMLHAPIMIGESLEKELIF